MTNRIGPATRVSVLSVIVLLSGCSGLRDGVFASATSGQSGPAPPVVSSGPAPPVVSSGPAPPVEVAPIDPCTGADAGCSQVATVDVDGDGVLDTVGISITRQPAPPTIAFPPATITVHVGLRGQISTASVASPGLLPGKGSPAEVFVGAYRISRTSGADLVLHTRVGGGSSEQFAVLGWQGSTLSLVPAPMNVDPQTPTVVWTFASSHGKRASLTCSEGASVTLVTQSAATVEGTPVPGGGLRELDQYTYGNGQWTIAGSTNSADTSFSYDFTPHTDTFQCAAQNK